MSTIELKLEELQNRLLWLSHEIGREDRHLAMLGEGNASAHGEDGTFWIKASGGNLKSLEAAELTRVRFDRIFEALDGPALDDPQVREVLLRSKVHEEDRLPSVETFLHAVCLQEEGVRWVGHCHPVSVLQILCSQQGATPFLKHIFPDEIVVCGRHLVVVPYVDPGITLALKVRQALREFREVHGVSPKLILMENHGPVALGRNEKEALNILLMLDKWARILVGSFPLGGPKFLPEATSLRIDTRPDELYRRGRIDSSSRGV